jgi:hypothetical protein
MVEEQEDNLDDIRELYPQFTDKELRIARNTLQNYVRVMYRIYERVQKEQGPEAASKLARGE